MKKKILTFIFAFMLILPLSFSLFGCDSKTNKNMSIKDFEAKLETMQTAKNYTMSGEKTSTTKNSSITDGVEGSYTEHSDSQTTTIFANNDKYLMKNNIGDYNLITSTQEISQDSTGSSFMFKNTEDSQSNSTIKLLNFLQSKELIKTSLGLTNSLKNCSVKITEKDGIITVAYNLDLTEALTQIKNDIITYKADTLSNLINAVLSHLTGKTININNTVNKFLDTYTDNTTIQDAVTFLSNETGLDLEVIVKQIFNAMDIQKEGFQTPGNFADYILPENSKIGYLSTNSATNMEYDRIKSAKLSSLISQPDSSLTNKQIILNAINNYINSKEHFTLEKIIAASGNKMLETIMSNLNLMEISKFLVNANILFDSSLKVSKLDLQVESIVKSYSDEWFTNGSISNSKITSSFVFSNYGTTKMEKPTNKIDNFQIKIYANLMDMNQSTYSVKINNALVNIPAFSIVGTKQETGDQQITLIEYDDMSKTLAFNTELLKSTSEDGVAFLTTTATNETILVNILFN